MADADREVRMKGHSLYRRLAEIAPNMPTMREQAEALGLTVRQLKFVRYRARLVGFDISALEADYSARAPQLARVDAEMSGSGCERCGLRGPHGCLDEAARMLLTNQRAVTPAFRAPAVVK